MTQGDAVQVLGAVNPGAGVDKNICGWVAQTLGASGGAASLSLDVNSGLPSLKQLRAQTVAEYKKHMLTDLAASKLQLHYMDMPTLGVDAWGLTWTDAFGNAEEIADWRRGDTTYTLTHIHSGALYASFSELASTVAART